MKKRIVAVILVVAMALSLSACLFSGFEGTYKMVSVNGEDIGSSDEGAIYFEFKDGTVTCTVAMAEGSGGTTKGTYMRDGSDLTMVIENSTLKGTYKNGKITFSKDGESIVLEKKSCKFNQIRQGRLQGDAQMLTLLYMPELQTIYAWRLYRCSFQV